MKNVTRLLSAIMLLCFVTSCTKTESKFDTPVAETITVVADQTSLQTNKTVKFTVLSSINNANVTAASKLYINGTVIVADTFKFTTVGTYAVFATKGTLTTNVITLQVTAAPVVTTGYVHNVLVEEYSGTWCGNCPRLLYGVDLLEQQTTKAVVVGIHLFNNDPFISATGNSLAASLGVSGVPTGNINRTTSWTAPQYDNVAQVLNLIQPITTVGLAISSTNSGGTIAATIKLSYKQTITSNTKLHVYIVEDNLYNTQSNYSANLYGGLSSIPNFKYNGVLRNVVTPIAGDDVANTGALVTKAYNLALPTNVSNTTNTRIVAFITDATGKVINVQTAKLGEVKDFENI